VKSACIFSQKHVSRTITSHVIHISWLQHGYKVEISLKNSWMWEVRLNFFTKTCLTNNYFSRDQHFVILAWKQSWNIHGKHMKLWSPLEFFNKNISHEQSLFTWSTFRDSSMGTKLKYFWKTHESVKSAWIFHRNMSHEQLLFTWSTFCDSSMGAKLKYFWKTHESVKSAWIFSQKHVSRTITFHVKLPRLHYLEKLSELDAETRQSGCRDSCPSKAVLKKIRYESRKKIKK